MIYCPNYCWNSTTLASFRAIRTIISNSIVITFKILRSQGSKDLYVVFDALEVY